ncbi:MAG TPA: OPT/YSL family transporter [Candidatus Krumholzibacteria bacterium]|nr:OPT/YSL family transporter [Candidatus Krumholzibacteria bacterium]
MTPSPETRTIRPGPYPELTVTGILVGYALGIVITISITYAALILGFSIEGSELAAILGFGVLRGLLRRTSIVENNINQTLASSVNAASPGLVFSLAVLFVLGYTDFSRVIVILGCVAGAILGIAFIIPLRKQMIDFNRLAFPGGVAVATVLKSPGAGMRKARLLTGAAAVSGLVHFLALHFGHEDFALGRLLHLPDYMNGVWYVSLLTIGTGFIAGKGGVYFVVGGFTCYWILAPLLSAQGVLPSPDMLAGTTIADYLRTQLFRPLGIGMLIGGALTGIALAFPLVISAIHSMQAASKIKSSHSRDEMPIRLLYVAILAAFAVLFFMADHATPHMTLGRGLLMALIGVFWIWMSGVILSECTGRTNWSPLSGMTLIGVTLLLIVSRGLGNKEAIVAAVMVGAAMCIAMAQATDLMLDLKTGYLVGATPRKQQIAQMLGALLGPVVAVTVLFVLHAAKGIGSDSLPAPQAQALAATINGILGGNVPVQKYASGAVLGAILSASGVGGLGVLVGLGFYLPFNIILTYTIGTVSRVATDRYAGRAFAEDVGIPVAAGFIVGEALVGVGHALAAVFGR